MVRLVERLGLDRLWLLTGQGDPQCEPDFTHVGTVDRVVGLKGRVSALNTLGAQIFSTVEALRSRHADPAPSGRSRPALHKAPLVDLTGGLRRRVWHAHRKGATVGKIALGYQVSRVVALTVIEATPPGKKRNRIIYRFSIE